MTTRDTANETVRLLNAATKGSLLGVLADALRATSQAPGRPGQSIKLQALSKLVDGLRGLNSDLAERPVVMQAQLTSEKPVRLFLVPQSATREIRIVFEILNESDAGELDRVKACEYCQRFFVARRDVDRFCPGTSCR